MNKVTILLFLIIFISGCSLQKNSKFWSPSKNIKEENIQNFKEIFVEKEALTKELNTGISINLRNKG